MWEEVKHGEESWRRRQWNRAFVAEYKRTPSGFHYRIYEDPTDTLLVDADAYSMTPERLERLLEGDLRMLAMRDTRETPQVG